MEHEYRYAVRKIERAEADRLRSRIAITLLTEIIARMKNELDPAAWLNGGWPELEAFAGAVCHGGMHPALLDWQQAKDTGGRPAPCAARDLCARIGGAALRGVGARRPQ